MSYRRSLSACMSIGVFFLLGCGGADRPVPVSGTITLNGSPLADAQMTVHPANGGRPARGQSDKDGKFEITTYKPNDGALPGQYKVTITMVDPEAEQRRQRLNDPKLDPIERAALSKAQSSKKLTGVHANYSQVDKTPLTLDVPPKGSVKFELNKDGI